MNNYVPQFFLRKKITKEFEGLYGHFLQELICSDIPTTEEKSVNQFKQNQTLRVI